MKPGSGWPRTWQSTTSDVAVDSLANLSAGIDVFLDANISFTPSAGSRNSAGTFSCAVLAKKFIALQRLKLSTNLPTDSGEESGSENNFCKNGCVNPMRTRRSSHHLFGRGRKGDASFRCLISEIVLEARLCRDFLVECVYAVPSFASRLSGWIPTKARGPVKLLDAESLFRGDKPIELANIRFLVLWLYLHRFPKINSHFP